MSLSVGLQDLCARCTDFIISELWTSNFLAYQVIITFEVHYPDIVAYLLIDLFVGKQVFAESQDYGIHGERVRNACWGYLCQSGSVELKEVKYYFFLWK